MSERSWQEATARAPCQNLPVAEERDDQDGSPKGPSLEPPSLFKRKKKQPKAPAPEPTPERTPEPTPEPTPAPEVHAEPVAPPPPAPPRSPAPAKREPAPAPAAVPPRPEPVVEQLAPLAPDEPLDTPRELPVREPWLVGRPAAVLTGLLVGALVVALTAGSLRLCTSVKGTSSCGGPGFFLLVAILVVAVLVGAALLRGAHVPQPGSTSFLAVGLLSVVALLFLVDQLFEWWMVIAIPLVSVLTFVLSHWVTTAFIEPGDDAADPSLEPERHDVR